MEVDFTLLERESGFCTAQILQRMDYCKRNNNF